MNRKKAVPQQRTKPTNKLLLAGRALLVVAIFLAGYLTVVSLGQSGVAGCGEGASCGKVLGSKYSKLLGVPVGAVGGMLYLAVLAGTFFSDRWKHGRLSLYSAMVMIPLGAAWFAILQVSVLKAFCPWCCSTHLVATAGVLFIAVSYRKARPAADQGYNLLGLAVPVALAAVTSLVVIQSISPEPNSVESFEMAGGTEIAAPSIDPEAPRMFALHEGRVEFDVRDLPMLGSPNAEHIIAAVADYSCGHCRNLHRMLAEVQSAYGDEKLGIVFLPGLRNGDSQKIFEVMLPLWKSNREVFDKLEGGLLAGRISQTPVAVRAAAASHFESEEQLDALLAQSRPWAIEKIKLGAKLFHENSKVSGRKVLPQLVIGSEVMVGASKTTEKYFATLGEEFDLVRSNSVDSEGLVNADSEGRNPGVAIVSDVEPDAGKPVSATEKDFTTPGEEFGLERLNSEESVGLENTDTGGKNPGVVIVSNERGPDAAAPVSATKKNFVTPGEEFGLERSNSVESKGLENTDTGGKNPGVANNSIESGPDPGVEQAPVVKKRVADPVTRVRYSRHASKITYDYGGGRSYSVETAQLPMWGNADAAAVALFLVDFKDADARAAGARLRDLQRQLGDEKLAVAILPAMPTGAAQELHRHLLPLWKKDPAAYYARVDRLFSGDEKPQIPSTGNTAEVSSADAQWLQRQLVGTHRIYAANHRATKRRGVPHLMIGDAIYVGKIPGSESLEKVILAASASSATEKTASRCLKEWWKTGTRAVASAEPEMDCPLCQNRAVGATTDQSVEAVVQLTPFK